MKPACDPADASESDAALAGADLGGEAAEDAERQTERRQQDDQEQIVTSGRKRA